MIDHHMVTVFQDSMEAELGWHVDQATAQRILEPVFDWMAKPLMIVKELPLDWDKHKPGLIYYIKEE